MVSVMLTPVLTKHLCVYVYICVYVYVCVGGGA